MVITDGLEPAEHAASVYNMCAGPRWFGNFEALVSGDATDTASRTGIDAWLVNASARGPSRGCLHDAVDAALTLWISASASATSMVST